MQNVVGMRISETTADSFEDRKHVEKSLRATIFDYVIKTFALDEVGDEIQNAVI